MSNENSAVLEAPVTGNATKGKGAKKPAGKGGKAITTKGKPVKAAKKPLVKKPTTQAADGSLRGVAKPAGWKPEKQLMATYLAAQAEGTKGIELAEYINAAQTRALQLLSKAKGPIPATAFLEPRKEFDNKATISSDSYVGVWVGRKEADKRAASEKKWGYVSLITMGCVKVYQSDDNDKKQWVYEITPQGRKWLERKLKADQA